MSEDSKELWNLYGQIGKQVETMIDTPGVALALSVLRSARLTLRQIGDYQDFRKDIREAGQLELDV